MLARPSCRELHKTESSGMVFQKPENKNGDLERVQACSRARPLLQKLTPFLQKVSVWTWGDGYTCSAWIRKKIKSENTKIIKQLMSRRVRFSFSLLYFWDTKRNMWLALRRIKIKLFSFIWCYLQVYMEKKAFISILYF